MSDLKISQLTAGVPAITDILPYVDLGTNTTKKTLKSNLFSKAIITIGPAGTDANYICTGTSDDIIIQTALNATVGIILMLPGTYQITNPLVLPTGTILTGYGQTNTILQITPSALSNFHFEYIIADSSGDNCHISDLSLDGNYSNLTTPPANYGGLMAVGNGWRVKNVEFKSSNYFKLWINGVNDVQVNNIYFSGTVGAGNDCIGGGGNCSNIYVLNAKYIAGVNGNALDITNGSEVYYMFAKNVNTPVIFEGVVDSTIAYNDIVAGGITVQSDAGYPSHTTVTNPKNVIVQFNTVRNSPSNGILLKYSNGSLATVKGGYNTISGNNVRGSYHSGILAISDAAVLGVYPSIGGDKILNNTCIDNNQENAATYNTGYGVCNPSGINILQAFYPIITGNTCTNEAGTTQKYGIQLGRTDSTTDAPTNVLVDGNNVAGNASGDFNATNSSVTYRGANASTTDRIGLGGVTNPLEMIQLSTGGTTGAIRYGDSYKQRGKNGDVEFFPLFSSKLFKIYEETGANALFAYDMTNGKLSLGTGASPDAVLKLKAGTATAGTAPLKFTSGTSLATPENGAIEYDGTHYYGTTGGVRYQLDQQGGGGGGTGTVTSVSVTSANGVSGSVANATTTPAISLTLGAITPTSVNGTLIPTGTATANISTRGINAQSGTTYTFVIGDAINTICTFGSASATTVTVPTNASVAFPVGSQIDCSQVGAGKVTFAPAGGVTINSQAGNLSIAARYVGVSLVKTATDTWLLLGNLIA